MFLRGQASGGKQLPSAEVTLKPKPEQAGWEETVTREGREVEEVKGQLPPPPHSSTLMLPGAPDSLNHSSLGSIVYSPQVALFQENEFPWQTWEALEPTQWCAQLDKIHSMEHGSSSSGLETSPTLTPPTPPHTPFDYF